MSRPRYLRAEAVVVKAAQENRRLTADEHKYLASEFGWDQKYREKQYSRIRRVLKLKAIAGHALDRELLRRHIASQEAELKTVTDPKEINSRKWSITIDKRRLREANFAFDQLQSPKLAPPYTTPETTLCLA